MRYLALMDRKAIGLGLAAFMVAYAAVLLIAGAGPSDTELQLAFVVALGAGFAVSFVVMRREFPKDK